ncbi:MAG: SRPBCC family protein [Myxococcales bacterium]
MSRLDGALEPSPHAQQRGRELSLTLGRGSPLVLARAARLGISPERLFEFIVDFERLPEWMPMMKACQVDNTHAREPGGVGAVRVIDSGFGKPTRETVVALERPSLLAYSADDASLRGLFSQHLGVLISEPHPLGGAWLSWLSYAKPGAGPQKFLGPGVFKLVVQQSLSRLGARFPLAT